jgi:hypothetical protein
MILTWKKTGTRLIQLERPMRKALVVGIDHYEHIGSLNGCVNDACSIKELLDRNADGTVNFVQPKLIVGTGSDDIVERATLKEAVRQLFADDSDIALFYFAGHGYVEATGGYLCAGDCKTGDDGLPLSEIMTFANKSPARSRIIILDSCHSGVVGDHAVHGQLTEIAEGVTILTASTRINMPQKRMAAECLPACSSMRSAVSPRIWWGRSRRGVFTRTSINRSGLGANARYSKPM